MDTLLPELKYEIIKHLPYYRTIDKTLYKDVEKYNEFCCQPIRIKEFRLKRDYGKFIYFFTTLTNKLTIGKIGKFEILLYHINTTNELLSVENGNLLPVEMDRINIRSINNYINNSTYYDLKTSYKILKKRWCTKPNFIEDQLIKGVNHLNPLQLYIYKKCIIREIYFEWLKKKINSINFGSIQICPIIYKTLLIEHIKTIG